MDPKALVDGGLMWLHGMLWGSIGVDQISLAVQKCWVRNHGAVFIGASWL